MSKSPSPRSSNWGAAEKHTFWTEETSSSSENNEEDSTKKDISDSSATYSILSSSQPSDDNLFELNTNKHNQTSRSSDTSAQSPVPGDVRLNGPEPSWSVIDRNNHTNNTTETSACHHGRVSFVEDHVFELCVEKPIPPNKSSEIKTSVEECKLGSSDKDVSLSPSNIDVTSPSISQTDNSTCHEVETNVKHLLRLSLSRDSQINDSGSLYSLICQVGSEERILSELSVCRSDDKTDEKGPLASSSSSHSQIAYREKYFGKTPKRERPRRKVSPLRLHRPGLLENANVGALKQEMENVYLSSSLSSQPSHICFSHRYLSRLGMDSPRNKLNEKSPPLSSRSQDGAAEMNTDTAQYGFNNKPRDRQTEAFPILPPLVRPGSSKPRSPKKRCRRNKRTDRHGDISPKSPPLSRGDFVEMLKSELIAENGDEISELSFENIDRILEKIETYAPSIFQNKCGFETRPKPLVMDIDNDRRNERNKVRSLSPRVKESPSPKRSKSKPRAENQTKSITVEKSEVGLEKNDIRNENTEANTSSPRLNKEHPTAELKPDQKVEGDAVDEPKIDAKMMDDSSSDKPKADVDGSSLEKVKSDRKDDHCSIEDSSTVQPKAGLKVENSSFNDIKSGTDVDDNATEEPKADLRIEETPTEGLTSGRSSVNELTPTLGVRTRSGSASSAECRPSNKSNPQLSSKNNTSTLVRSITDDSNQSRLSSKNVSRVFKSEDSVMEPRSLSAVSITKQSSDREKRTSSTRRRRTTAETSERSYIVSDDVLEFYAALTRYMKKKGYFDEFPSPSLLGKAVGEYETLDINWPLDEYGVICPCPPDTVKGRVVHHRRMLMMDKHALTLPEAFMKRPLFEAVQYLTTPAQTEIEIARVMFRWLTAQDLHLEIFNDLLVNELPGDYTCVLLKKLKSGQLLYSDLYLRMARYANIEGVKLPGACRRISENPRQRGFKLKVWTWTSLFLEGDWRLVDCHMGAICWKESKQLKEISNTKETNASKKNNALYSSALTYFLNDFYFMTDPKDLIFSHFPSKLYWQLLPRPVKFSEFINIPFLRPVYFFFSIQTSLNNKLCLIAQNGKVLLEFTFPENIRMAFSYRLRKVQEYENGAATSNKDDKLATENYDDFVFLDHDYKKNMVKISITPPKDGQYVFYLYGRNSSDQHTTKMSHLCSYVVQCSYVDTTFAGFPHNELMEWGPGMAAEDIGMTPVSHFEGIVNTVDGKTEIKFALSKDLEFDQHMLEKGHEGKRYDNYTINRIDNGHVIFSINPPKKGDYCLKIYAKDKNETSKFDNVCTYFIHCDGVLEEPTPYPKIACGRIGIKDECGRLGLKVMRPQSSIIYAPENGRISIKFLASKPILISPELYYCDEQGNLEKHADNASQRRHATYITVNANFPKRGLYYLTVSAKNPNDDKNFAEVYTAIVYCDYPLRVIMTDPTYLAGWKSNYILHHPKHKYLQEETMTNFSLTVPDATDVLVTTADTTYHLDTKGDGMWESVLDTGRSKDKSVLEVTACLTDKRHKSQSYSPLLHFNVVSQHDLEKIHDTQRENYEKAIEKINLLKKEGKWREPPRQPDVHFNADDISPLIIIDSKEMLLPTAVDSGLTSDQPDVYCLTPDPSTHTEFQSPMLAMMADDTYYVTDSSNNESDVEPAMPPGTSSSRFREWEEEQDKLRKRKEEEELQGESQKIKVGIMRNRLKSNIKSKNKSGLKSAVAEAQKEKIGLDSPEYSLATRTISVLSLRDEIMYYMLQKDVDRVKYLLSAIERRGFAGDIPHEVAKAKASIVAMPKKSPKPRPAAVIDVPTLAEIGRYHNPPAIVHRMFMAVLLLMGVHEGITKKWKRCHKICAALGAFGMKKHFTRLNVKDIPPSIAARVREILEVNIPEEADAVSPGTGALYRWAMGVVDDVLVPYADSHDPVEPAKPKQQKKLLKNSKIVDQLSLNLLDLDEYLDRKQEEENWEKHYKIEWRS